MLPFVMNIHKYSWIFINRHCSGKWIALNNLRELQTFSCKKSRHQLGKVGKSPLYFKSNVYKNQSFMNASFLHSVYLFEIIHKCKLNKIFKNIMHREMEKYLNIHVIYIYSIYMSIFRLLNTDMYHNKYIYSTIFCYLLIELKV